MISRLCKTLIVAALACSIGLHWALFQSLAWAGMVITYSQNGTLTEALVKTFDGRHPCPLCKEIAKGKQAEKKSDVRPEWAKFEFSHVGARFVFTRPSRFWRICDSPEAKHRLTYRPAVPPPKFLA